MADEADRRAEDGPYRPEVRYAGRRPDGEHDGGHREEGGEVNAHALAGRGGAGGAAAWVGAPDAIERQIGDKLLEPAGGVGLEGLLHALLVFSEVEVALRECLSQASGRLLPVAVADAVDCRGGHEAGPFGRM